MPEHTHTHPTEHFQPTTNTNTMPSSSPLSHLLTSLPLSRNITSPLLNYIDEFDRHFSHHHRFMTCFIPRFDLEEDASSYYLSGELPGAREEDIDVEVRDKHTLVIAGKTQRANIQISQEGEQEVKRRENLRGDGNGEGYVKVEKNDAEGEYGMVDKRREEEPHAIVTSPSSNTTTDIQPHLQHAHHTSMNSTDLPIHPNLTATPAQNQNVPQVQHTRHVMLQERLFGPFHRTFNFPQEIVEEGVQAGMENGILSVVIPKKVGGKERDRGRKVKVNNGHGGWNGIEVGRADRERDRGQERGSGFGFASGAV